MLLMLMPQTVTVEIRYCSSGATVSKTSNVKTVASGSPVIPTCYNQHNKTGRQEEHCYLLGLVKSSCYNVQLSAHSNYS